MWGWIGQPFIAVFEPSDDDDWLGARSTDEARAFITLPDATLMHADAQPKPAT